MRFRAILMASAARPRPNSAMPPAAPMAITGSLPDGAIDVDYLSSGDVAVTGGTGPFTASLSGAPAGLSVAMEGRDLVFTWSNPA